MQQNYRIVRCARSWGSSLTLSDSRFGMSCRSALFGVLLLRFLLCSALTPEPAGPLLHLPFCHRIEWPHRFQYTSSWTTYVLFGHSSYAGALHTPDPIPSVLVYYPSNFLSFSGRFLGRSEFQNLHLLPRKMVSRVPGRNSVHCFMPVCVLGATRGPHASVSGTMSQPATFPTLIIPCVMVSSSLPGRRLAVTPVCDTLRQDIASLQGISGSFVSIPGPSVRGLP